MHQFLNKIGQSLFVVLIAVMVALASLLPAATVQAQLTEPTTIIDTAFADLSIRIGRPISRATLPETDRFAWEQTFFKGAVTCPGTTSDKTEQIKGWIIRITLGGVDYEYHAKDDGSELYYCNVAQGQQIAVIAPGVPAGTVTGQGQAQSAGSVNVIPGVDSATFKSALAFVGSTGDVIVTMGGIEAQAVYLTNDAGLIKITQSPFYQSQHTYANLRWSPDGTKLAFVDHQTHSLFIAVSGQKARQVAQGVQTEYPPAWSPDGSSVAYLVNTNTASDNKRVLQAQAVDAATFQPRAVGTVLEAGGCGGGGIFPPSAILRMRENSRPLSADQTFVWADQGFIHSYGCSGNGLAYSTFAGQAIWAQQTFNFAVVSPDRKLAIGFTSGRFTGDSNPTAPQGFGIINIGTGAISPITLQPNVDLLAWSNDSSSVLYSTVTGLRTVALNATTAAAQQLLGADSNGLTASRNAVTLWRVPAAGGQSEQLYSGEGFLMGNIATYNPDQVVVFSFITSEAEMIEQINANAPVASILPLVPTIEIRGVSLVPPIGPNSAFSWFQNAGNPAPGRGGVDFTAVAMGPAPTGAPAANTGSTAPNAQGNGNFKVGDRAVVVVDAGSSLNLRENPSANAQVRRTLKNQETVTILGGPQLADGFRWWRVQADSDSNQGWVVDQVQGANGPEDTLRPIQ
jgi:hypothetical protein